MPADLREQAEQAAKAAGRSLNAELVNRLEASFLTESGPKMLMPANKARELAMMARTGIADEIRKRAIESIHKAITLGHSDTLVNLSDLQLESGIPDREVDSILNTVLAELIKAGYQAKVDDVTMIWIGF